MTNWVPTVGEIADVSRTDKKRAAAIAKYSLSLSCIPYRLAQYCTVLLSQVERERHKKLFTVVTVNYNNLQGLKRTVASVNNQSVRDLIQYVVVDGESTDGSIEYLKSIPPHDIDICTFGKDSGVYDAMNRGLSLANSEYVIFMNSGDEFFSSNVCGEVQKVTESPHKPDVIYGATMLDGGAIWQPEDVSLLWKGMICSHQSMFFNTDLAKKFGYSEHNKIVSDFEFIADFYVSGLSFKKIEITISKVEPVGISSNFSDRTFERWGVVRRKFLSLLKVEDIDSFYRSLLSTRGCWVNPKKFDARAVQNDLIGNVESRLIFLISMPRSGSTLLQKILNMSDDIATGGEPWLMLPLLSMYSESLIQAKYGQKLNCLAKEEFVSEVGDSGIITNAQKCYADSVYSSALRAHGRRYFLDKTPRYVHIVDQLAELYPKAKFIVLVREPAAVISSYANTWLGGDYSKLLEDDYFRFDFESGFSSLAKFSASSDNNKLVVRYEDLVCSPELEANRIFEYLSLGFDPSFLDYGAKAESSVKYMFGDPSSVYNKNRPDESHAEKWVADLRSKRSAYNLIKVLDMVPDKAYADLGYSKRSAISKVQEAFPVFLPPVEGFVNKYADKYPVCLDGKAGGEPLDGSESKPLSVGVLITCFNNESTIVDAVKSVLEQTRPPDLVVVADDCSSDDSVKILKQYLSHQGIKGVHVLLSEVNRGVAKNRDYAIRQMNVDLVTTLDGDDLYYPSKIEREYRALVEENAQIAISDILVLLPDEEQLLKTVEYAGKSVESVLNYTCSRKFPVPRDFLFTKQLYLDSCGFDCDMEIYEDWALKLRMFWNAGDFGCVHSGTIGTLYDRRAPGLSSKPKIYHAYGQLLAIARNVDILGASPLALKEGLQTSSRSLEGGTKRRFDEFLGRYEGERLRFLYEDLNLKLRDLWMRGRCPSSTKEMAQAFWELSSQHRKQMSPESGYKNIFSVCTPSFNSATTIERTFVSVASQAAEDPSIFVRYHIQDGLSSDSTVKVVSGLIDKYKDLKNFEATIESSSDQGMYDAINRSFEKLGVEEDTWMTWINSDDFFEKGAFSDVAKVAGLKECNIQWLTGTPSVYDAGEYKRSFVPVNRHLINIGACDGALWNFVQQEGTFFKGRLWKKIDFRSVVERYKYAGDWALWVEFSKHEDVFLMRRPLANFCVMENQLSARFKEDYMGEIDDAISEEVRLKSFLHFPVYRGETHIVEKSEDDFVYRTGSILGQFDHMLSLASKRRQYV